MNGIRKRFWAVPLLLASLLALTFCWRYEILQISFAPSSDEAKWKWEEGAATLQIDYRWLTNAEKDLIQISYVNRAEAKIHLYEMIEAKADIAAAKSYGRLPLSAYAMLVEASENTFGAIGMTDQLYTEAAQYYPGSIPIRLQHARYLREQKLNGYEEGPSRSLEVLDKVMRDYNNIQPRQEVEMWVFYKELGKTYLAKDDIGRAKVAFSMGQDVAKFLPQDTPEEKVHRRQIIRMLEEGIQDCEDAAIAASADKSSTI